eukprot:scaffold112009_cov19-Tisochrysis_lutea.AAC.1
MNSKHIQPSTQDLLIDTLPLQVGWEGGCAWKSKLHAHCWGIERQTSSKTACAFLSTMMTRWRKHPVLDEHAELAFSFKHVQCVGLAHSC